RCGLVREPQRRTVAQLAARIETRVEQMARHEVAERLEHRLLHAGMLLFQIENQALHALALQAEVAARRTAAADDRQLALLSVEARLGLLHVDQRPDDDVLTVIGNESSRH